MSAQLTESLALKILAQLTVAEPSPARISDMALWFRADAGTYQTTGTTTPAIADGSPVGRWEDQSGNARHATQATAGSRPIRYNGMLNGQPVIVSDGVDDFLTFSSTNLGTAATAFVVLAFLAPKQAGTVIGRVHPVRLLHYDGADGIYYGDGGSVNVAYGITADEYQSLSVKRDGTTVTWYRGGQQNSLPATLGSNAAQAITSLFAREDAGAPSLVSVAEIIVYARALSDGERRTVEEYLASRYDL